MFERRIYWQICAIPLGTSPDDPDHPDLEIIYDHCVALKPARNLVKMAQERRRDFVFCRRVEEQIIKTYEREAVVAALAA